AVSCASLLIVVPAALTPPANARPAAENNASRSFEVFMEGSLLGAPKIVVANRVSKAVDLLLGLVLGNAVLFLDLADELITLASDPVEVVVRELAPLFFHLPLHLLPIP